MSISQSRVAEPEPYSLRAGVRPLVILGAARSGTKFLRHLLGASAACTAVPHGLNFVWREGAPTHSHDAIPAEAYSATVRQSIRKTVLRLAGASSPSDVRFVVERTCANTLRLPAVHTVFPDARYIHIVRDGRDVAASASEQWAQSPALLPRIRKWFAAPGAAWRHAKRRFTSSTRSAPTSTGWGPHYPGMEDDLQQFTAAEVCALQWRACIEACQRDRAPLIPADRFFTVRYEELVTDPEIVVRLCACIDLPDPSAVLDRYRQTVRCDSIGRWKRTFNPVTAGRVQARIASTLQHLGYAA